MIAMKLPSSMSGVSDYVQPSETSMTSSKSPLELLANACNKLESDMMTKATSGSGGLAAYSKPASSAGLHTTPSPSPPTSAAYHKLGEVGLPPASRAPTNHADLTYGSSSGHMVARPPAGSPLGPSRSPASPVLHPPPPKRPEVAGLKVKSAEALSPRPQMSSPINRSSSTNNPNSSSRHSTSSSPRSTLSASPHRPAGSGGLVSPAAASLPPPHHLAAAASNPYLALHQPPPNPYAAYLSMFGGPAGGAGNPLGPPGPPGGGGPCTDPLCRDPSCPTYAMRLAQAQMMASMSASLHHHPSLPPPHHLASLGYPYSLPAGYPPPPPMSLAGPSPYGLYPPPPPPGITSAQSLPGLPHPYLTSLASQFPFGPPPTSSSSAASPPTSSSSPRPPSSQPPPPPTSSSSSGVGVGSSPYLCSWMQGRDFCGRRFNSSEELMAHLRSHTTSMGAGGPPPEALNPHQQPPISSRSSSPLLSSSSSGPPALTSASAPPSALAMLQAQAASLRGQPSPSSASIPQAASSPSSSALIDPRYHPYGRPPSSSSASSLLLGAAPGGGGSPLPPHLSSPFLASLYGSPRPPLPVLP